MSEIQDIQVKMTSERIKEIQKETGYPDSSSVQQALLKVWNETEQVSIKEIDKLKAALKEVLTDAINYWDNYYPDNRPAKEVYAEEIKLCGLEVPDDV